MPLSIGLLIEVDSGTISRMSIGTMERQGAFSDSDYAEYSNDQLPGLNTDGSGSMRGNGDNDDDGDGEGRCVVGEYTERYNTTDLQGLTAPELVKGNDLRPGDNVVVRRACGKTGCALALTFNPHHGLFQQGRCREQPR